MSEEKKEVTEQPASKEPDEIQLEDILETAFVVSQEKTSEKTSVDEKSTEVTTEPKTKKPEEPAKSEKKKEEVIPKEKPKYSDNEVEVWRKDSENKKEWQKTQTQKSQIINKYSDDEIELISAKIKLENQTKEFKPEPLPDVFIVKDEFGEDVNVKTEILKPQIEKLIENAKNKWIEEFAPQIKDAEKYRVQAEQATGQAKNQAGIVRIEQYFGDHPNVGFDLGDDPIQTINDIKNAGSTHPDYKKLLNLDAVAHRSEALGCSMKEAHIDLFGKTEQIKKADEIIKEEQKSMQQEKPGQKSKVVTEDEAFDQQMEIGTKQKENVFD
ncbi:MAG: hypothetical protein KKD44_29670 [Proteobacteria bacterium]|nr:hypothetical protein [Pseudomonadota bacterium]